MHNRFGAAGALLLTLFLIAASPLGHAPLVAQSPGGRSQPGAALLPSDVSYVVRIDAVALSRSGLVPELLDNPAAENPLARALARPRTLEKIGTVYVGLPASVTPDTRELPVLLVGSFDADEMAVELASARGIERRSERGRTYLVADWDLGTTWVTPLGEGILALGDEGSVRRMVEVAEGRTQGNEALLAQALALKGQIVGVGRIPRALREYMQAEGGGLAAPFASVDRISFQGSLGRVIDLQMSLFSPTPEGRQAIQQALGALRMFGPSRFANDPEVLSAIQSLRFTPRDDRVDVSFVLPRSLVLEML